MPVWLENVGKLAMYQTASPILERGYIVPDPAQPLLWSPWLYRWRKSRWIESKLFSRNQTSPQRLSEVFVFALRNVIVRHLATASHRRRSDWNSGGTHGGIYYKSSAVEAKTHIFLHCNASNMMLKILQHDKIWGGTIPCSKFWGDLSPRPPSPPWSTPIQLLPRPFTAMELFCSVCEQMISKRLRLCCCCMSVLWEGTGTRRPGRPGGTQRPPTISPYLIIP